MARMLLPFLIVFFFACTNTNISPQSNTTLNGTGTGSTATTNTANTAGFTITQALINAHPSPPSVILDITTTGSNYPLLTNCPLQANNANGQPTPCVCTFSYAFNGTAQTQTSAVTYAEGYDARCAIPTNLIPESATNLAVFLTMTNIGTQTNALSLGQISSFDTTNLNSYAPILQYTCRITPQVLAPFGTFNDPNNGTPSVPSYDPYQSTSPNPTSNFQYFYTNSLANSIAHYVTYQQTNNTIGSMPTPTNLFFFDCDFMLSPIPQNKNSNYANGLYQPSGGSTTTAVNTFHSYYPLIAETSTTPIFYLSPQPTPIFNKALEVYIAPYIDARDPSIATGTTTAIGWGALPTPSGSNYSCPSSSLITLPSNTKWALLTAGVLQIPLPPVYSLSSQMTSTSYLDVGCYQSGIYTNNFPTNLAGGLDTLTSVLTNASLTFATRFLFQFSVTNASTTVNQNCTFPFTSGSFNYTPSDSLPTSPANCSILNNTTTTPTPAPNTLLANTISNVTFSNASSTCTLYRVLFFITPFGTAEALPATIPANASNYQQTSLSIFNQANASGNDFPLCVIIASPSTP